MHIHVNGKKQACAPDTTLLELIRQLELNPDKVVAEHNGEIIPAAQFAQTVLREEDQLELLQFVGGG